jgi:hypothetical protein
MRSELLYEMYVLVERPQTPVVLKRCVADVASQYGGDTDKAFAICVSSLQKSGRLEPGTVTPTPLGKKVSKEKSKESDEKSKVSKYEKLLKRAKKIRAKSK